VRRGYVKARLAVTKRHLSPHGYLHAASVILLADTCAGYGCLASLPEGAKSFTTIELKSNFLGTARDGVVECEARGVHLGKSTQVWDAEVTHNGKTIALFRCTQMILR
jgi:1,4-dihydroxy-2-naphthoyl-CoA hydrolase